MPDVVLEWDRPRSFDVARFFSDPDGNRLAYGAATNDPLTVGVSVTASEITLTPLRAGTAEVTVTASDPAGLSASQTFTVTVRGGNPPVVSEPIPDQALVSGGSPLVVPLANHFSDPDGETLTFEAVSTDTAVLRALVAERELVLIPLATGSVSVTVTATDPGGLSVAQTFEVTVGAGNRAPVVTDPIPDQTLPLGGELRLNLAEHFSDPDGDALTFSAAPASPNLVRAVVSGSELILTPLSTATGFTLVDVTATDPGGLSATQTFRLDVDLVNEPPVATRAIPDQTLAYGGGPVEVNLAEHFADPERHRLVFRAAPGGVGTVRVEVIGSRLVLTPVGVATTTVTVTATDPGGLSATQTFRVTVSAENRAPVALGSIRDRTIDLDRNHVRVSFAGRFADPDGDDLRFRAFSSDEDVVRPVVEGDDVILVPQDVGRATVTITATDPDGLTAVQRFEVTIYRQPARRPPTPSRLRVVDTGDDFIEWSWDPVDHATSYEVQVSRDTRFATPLDPIIGVDRTSYEATGLPEGVRVYLRVRSVAVTADGRAESHWSSPVAGMTSGATQAGNTLPVPANVRVTAATSASLVWTWDEVPDADGYELQYGRDANFGPANRVDSVPFTTVSIGPLSSETTYYLRVRAVAGAGATRRQSDWSLPSGGRTTAPTLFRDWFWEHMAFDALDCPGPGICAGKNEHKPALEDRVLRVLETTRPDFHIRTHNDRGDLRISDRDARTIRALIPEAVEALTGERYAGSITAGPEDVRRKDVITIEFVSGSDDPHFWTQLPSGQIECGRAIVGAVRGRIWLNADAMSVSLCQLHAIFPHEVGHALGFFHVQDSRHVMYLSGNGTSQFTPTEQFHARLAYQLGRGHEYVRHPTMTTSAEPGTGSTAVPGPAPVAICYAPPGSGPRTR